MLGFSPYIVSNLLYERCSNLKCHKLNFEIFPVVTLTFLRNITNLNKERKKIK